MCRCKCKYKLRWFYSKGAFLVLVWVLMSVTAMSSSQRTFQALLHNISYSSVWYSSLAPLVIGVLTIVPVGWLSNTKFGVYHTIKSGIYVLLLVTFFSSIISLFQDTMGHYKDITTNILVTLNEALLMVGGVALIIPILQLGLDQMPDASSSNITSFIAWVVFCIYGSIWISNVLFERIWRCKTGKHHYPTSSIQLLSLLPVSCMSVVVVTDFLLAKKWLVIEPKTSQTLKTAYQVVKFAWKHKAPLNRSALTYWEEDVPSRMDLGKSRFGGPFTTEQVEDVKIVLRLLVLSLPLWVLLLSENFGSASYIEPSKTLVANWTACDNSILYFFSYSTELWVLITTVLFEFVIYPIVRDKLPSILKRIGIIAFFNFVLSVLFLTLLILYHFHEEEYVLLWVLSVSFYVSRGIQMCLFLCAILELVCAQAPYNKRGFFTGYFICCIFISIGLGFKFTKEYSNFNVHLILFGVKVGVSVFGLVVYCLLARWYKMRVRDEEYCTQRVVEEVYDRYLSPK